MAEQSVIKKRREHDITPFERFWSKVDRSGSCWIWMKGKTIGGYGYTCFGSRKKHYAHRLAYEMLVGEIPFGLDIDHLCRNRACVNPAHLEPVTHRENVLRGTGLSAQRAKRTHCPAGHLLSGSNVYLTKKNQRMCRECLRLRGYAWRRTAGGIAYRKRRTEMERSKSKGQT